MVLNEEDRRPILLCIIKKVMVLGSWKGNVPAHMWEKIALIFFSGRKLETAHRRQSWTNSAK